MVETGQKKPVVLFVDDDQEILELARAKFEQVHGHKFLTATTLEEAAEIVRSAEEPMVVFVDIKWKGAPLGLKFVKWAYQYAPHRLVLYVLTADDSDSVHQLSLQSGAVAVFYKDSRKIYDRLVDYAEVSVVTRQLKLAYQDRVTGFWDFETFRKETLRQLEAARPPEGIEERRSGHHFSQFSLLFIELPGLRDMAGAENGNAVEQAVMSFSNIVRAHVRATDYLCRRSEGEFLIFLLEAQESLALRIAEEIRRSASEVKVTVNDREVGLGLRVGLNHIDRDDLERDATTDLDMMISKARRARK